MGCAGSKPTPTRSSGKGAPNGKGRATSNMDVLLTPVPAARPRTSNRTSMSAPAPAVRPRTANRSSTAAPARRPSRFQEHFIRAVHECLRNNPGITGRLETAFLNMYY
ncbi:hypothetical protein PspLS_11273 [Pyricularia sp. CBS 133598]|nr:hypothetical protein PspLS_11273 [Pyricularia sp. CBS 133598]